MPRGNNGAAAGSWRCPALTRRATALTAVLCVLLLTTACTSAGDSSLEGDGDSSRSEGSRDASGVPESLPTEAEAVVASVPKSQWRVMLREGVWRPGCPLTRTDLRRVEVNHYNFKGEIERGVLVVNRDVAPTVADIFTELFDKEFPIRRMRPVEAYGGDVNRSLADDNTSAYNCRRPDQINAPTLLSPHANGRAIDINPYENPWMDLRCDCWVPTAKTRARIAGPGVIVEGGLVWRLFRDEDWIWQNIKVPDYMHFDTGYPSKPYRAP